MLDAPAQKFDAQHQAQAAKRFANAYCQNPTSTPSRVRVLSGHYCHNHGYCGLSGGFDESPLSQVTHPSGMRVMH